MGKRYVQMRVKGIEKLYSQYARKHGDGASNPDAEDCYKDLLTDVLLKARLAGHDIRTMMESAVNNAEADLSQADSEMMTQYDDSMSP